MRFMLNSDNGYGNLKLYDGKKFIEIPSLVCNEEDVNVIQDVNDTIDNMIAEVKIITKDSIIVKNVAVGKKAKNGRARYNFSVNKIDSPNTVFPAIIGFAYLLLNRGVNDAILDITTTLTIDDFKYDENIKKFKEVFIKGWEVKFKYGHLKNKNCKILIEDNLTSAQGAVGIWDYVLNENSQIIKQIKGVKILGIDIGFETTDICVMDNMEFDDSRSFTIHVGMSDYNLKIVKEINNELKIRKTVEEMEQELKVGKIGNYTINHIQDKYYAKMTEEIIQAISGIIPSTIEFSDIILFGGGGYKTYNFFKQYDGFENIQLLDNPQLSNVRGSRKLAKLIWRGRNYNG